MSENIVKKTAKELGMTYKELAEAVGVSEGTIKRLATGEVTQQVEKSLEMLLNIKHLKEGQEDIQNFKMLLKKLTE